MLYAFQALTATLFYFQWFGLMLNVYLVTLGGVKWQPFLLEAKYDEEVEWDLKPSDNQVKVYVLVLIGFYFLYFVSIMVGYNGRGMLSFSSIMIEIMLLLVNPLVFKKVPHIPSEEEKVEEQPKEEKVEE